MLRSFVQRHSDQLSEQSRNRLSDLATEHDRIATDEEAIALENLEIEKNTESELQVGVPGIYVYTFPHYIKYPVVPTDSVSARRPVSRMLKRYSWMETLISCIAGHRFAELLYQPNSPYPSGKVSAQSHSRRGLRRWRKGTKAGPGDTSSP